MKLPNLQPEHFRLLENSYFRHFSEHIPEEIIRNYASIIEHKNLIRFAKSDKRILNSILDVAIEKIRKKQRFQKITFIKLIRSQCGAAGGDKSISGKLFFVFKSLLTETNESLLWSLSVTIKDIELSEDSIDWLIENFEESEHIQNRLLRYPISNKAVTEWAAERLKYGDLDHRLSELIALQLNFDTSFDHQDKTALLWGIHYSKLANDKKAELLLRHSTEENISDLIKICERNGFFSIILKLYNDYTDGISN